MGRTRSKIAGADGEEPSLRADRRRRAVMIDAKRQISWTRRLRTGRACGVGPKPTQLKIIRSRQLMSCTTGSSIVESDLLGSVGKKCAGMPLMATIQLWGPSRLSSGQSAFAELQIERSL